jgi:hypothetical protein
MDWDTNFMTLFERCTALYKSGQQDFTTYYSIEEQAFLQSIGYQPREFFDFVEDFCDRGEPTPSTALLVAAVRRDFFLTIQKGRFSDGVKLTREAAPPFESEFEGFVYLPRLLAKARAKLAGELDPDLMYGCGADRRFLREHGVHMADFLRHVWAAGGSDDKVVQWLRATKA